MIQAYFDNIEREIISAINSSESRLYAAVAWFTNQTIFDSLIQACQRQVKIKIVLLNDILNRNEFGLNFGVLAEKGADIRFSNVNMGTMHNKYCIIDNKVITGSYNWTFHANKNSENIIITDEVDVVNNFCEQFDKLFNEKDPLALPYEHIKWTDIKEGDFTELRRNMFRDVIAKDDVHRELKRIKLINLDHAYKSGNAEELANAALLPIEQHFRTITDVLTSLDKKYKGELFFKLYWNLEEESADIRFSKIGKWIFIPEQFGESKYHRQYIRGPLHYYDWMKRKKHFGKTIRIEIYDETFISAIKKYINGNDISKIPERLICIDLAKLSIYQLPVADNTKKTKENAIAVFCIVKEINNDRIVYYAGWDPKTRRERIAKML